MASKSKTTASSQQLQDTDEPVGRWAEILADDGLIQPYPITKTITISVPDADRAQEIRDADMALSLLRLKLAELLIDKGNETTEAQALDAIRAKLEQDPGNLTSQELSLLTAAIMRRRSGVPQDLFQQIADRSAEANARLDRALLGDQFDTVNAMLKGKNYDLRDRLLSDIKAHLLPTKLLPQALGNGDTSSATSSATGTTSTEISSTEG